MRIASVLLVVGLVGECVTLAAQGPPGAKPPSFEITSVKPTNLGGTRGGRLAPGLFEQTSITLRALVGMAYPGDVVGGPGWVDADRFDVVGKGDFPLSAFLPGSDGSAPPVYLMLRALLADRFKLVVHSAEEERPIYTLVFARADKKPGPGLHPANVDCDAVLAATARGETPALTADARRPPCSTRRGPGRITGNAIRMSQLAQVLSSIADRRVVDRTGAGGTFDVDLEWAELRAGPSGVPPPPNAAAGDDTPSIFTALQEQLGVKLEGTRGPVDIVVIDRAEHPAEN